MNRLEKVALIPPKTLLGELITAFPLAMSTAPSTQEPAPETIGEPKTKFHVEIGTKFLEHFSESLYSSPQKAFEELISNGWDAGASYVDVRIPKDLHNARAAMCVLDNGSSMNEDGLKTLWHIAFSPKVNQPNQHGRRVIGKFGIGKLATYVLANKLTYLCKAADGKIRRVTMDYGTIDQQADANRLISQIPLEIFEVKEEEVESALAHVVGGKELYELIKGGVKAPPNVLAEDEFGGTKADFRPPPSGTWTLVILTDLKPTGRALKTGILRRMLRTALPFGSEMAITLNEEALTSSKIDQAILKEWVIGPDLGIEHVTYLESEPTSGDGSAAVPANASTSQQTPADGIKKNSAAKETKVAVTSSKTPVPHIDIPGIGVVTGTVRLFQDEITKGVSEEQGSSNGFQVNVLGRTVNQQDPTFGEENLSHAVWARFRMAVRADGLNSFITTNREQFKAKPDLVVFKAFLWAVFNKARSLYNSEVNAGLNAGGDALVQAIGVVSLAPLRNVVQETLLKDKPPLPDLFDQSKVSDRTATLASWKRDAANNIRSVLGEVKYEKLNDRSLAKFRLVDNAIIVNKDHPFVLEHGRSKAEKELVRTVAMVNLLTDMYALDAGIKPSLLSEIREYRDQLLRHKAVAKRESGVYIASLLLETQHESGKGKTKQLELVLYDALQYLGFEVERLGQPGEPEGVARAYPSPTTKLASGATAPLYSFTFDAKTSGNESAQTGNLKLDAVHEHRERYKASYAMTVAPGYSGDAVDVRCQQQRVTPMTAHALGKLLEYTVEYGAISLLKLKEVFSLFKHADVSAWVENLGGWLKEQRKLTIDIFLQALKAYEGKIPDSLPAAQIGFHVREVMKINYVEDKDVVALVQGLHILAPDLIDIDGTDIIVNATATRLGETIASQLDKLRSS